MDQLDQDSIDPILQAAVIGQESSGNPYAVSPKGATGLMQLMPDTAREVAGQLGIPEDELDLNDPEQNKRLGSKYLRTQLDTFGDEKLALAAYNSGPDYVSKLRKKYGESYDDIAAHLWTETQNYVTGVQARKEKYGKNAERGAPAETGSDRASDTRENVLSSGPNLDTIPRTSAGFATALLPIIGQPEFDSLPLSDKAARISELYAAKKWTPDTYDVVKQVMANYWEASPPSERPDFNQFIDAPPRIKPEEPPDAAIATWKQAQITKLHNQGITPAIFGTALDQYLDAAGQAELDAAAARNRGIFASVAGSVGNFGRNVATGFAAGYTKPVAGVTRLAGGIETANAIEDLPSALLGKPANDYIFQTDENGYLILDKEGQPKTRWQYDAELMMGQVGSFLAGGFVLKALGYGSAAIRGTLFTGNALALANDSFRTVYEETGGDRSKAYTASLFSLPAAAVGSLGESAIISKWANPAISALSPFNKAKYLGDVFARNSVVGAASTVGMDVIQQTGEMSQTERAFDPERTFSAAVGGGVASGVISTYVARGAQRPEYSPWQPPPPRPPPEPPRAPQAALPAPEKRLGLPAPQQLRGPLDAQNSSSVYTPTVAEQKAAVAQLQKFQRSNASDIVLTPEQARRIPDEYLSLFALDKTQDADKVILQKRSTYVPPVEAEHVPTLDAQIESLHKQLVDESTPDRSYVLTERLGNLQREYVEASRGVNRSMEFAVNERNKLIADIENKKTLHQSEKDKTLKQIRREDVKEAQAVLDQFDVANEGVYSAWQKIGDLQTQIDATKNSLKRATDPNYPNDITERQQALDNLVDKRRTMLKQMQEEALAEAEKLKGSGVQAKEESAAAAAKKKAAFKSAKEKVSTLEKMGVEATEPIDFTSGVRVGENYILPVSGKYYVMDKYGAVKTAGLDYYADAVDAAQGVSIGQSRSTQFVTGPIEPVTRGGKRAVAEASTAQPQPEGAAATQAATTAEPTGPVNTEGGSAGAAFTKPSRFAERMGNAESKLNPYTKEGLGDEFGSYVRYMQKPHAESIEGGAKLIQTLGGPEAATKYLLELPSTTSSAEITTASLRLAADYDQAADVATAANNHPAAKALAEKASQLIENLSLRQTNAGQANEALKTMAQLSPKTRILAIKKKLSDAAVKKVAKKEGITFEEAVQSQMELTRVKDQRVAAEKTGDEKRAAELRKFENKLVKRVADIKLAQEKAENSIKTADVDKFTKFVNTARNTGTTIQQNALAEAAKLERKMTGDSASIAGANNWYATWLANQLSDVSTHVINIWGNAMNLGGSLSAYAVSGKGAGDMLSGIIKAGHGIGLDAAYLEMAGIKTYKPMADKLGGPGKMRPDLVESASPLMKKFGIDKLGYILRALSAEDAYFYKDAYEGMSRFAAADAVRKQGLKGEAAQKRISELLHDAPDQWANAMNQARTEVQYLQEAGKKLAPKTQEKLQRLRAYEILEEKRSPELRNEAFNFASKNTFNNKPEGYLGKLVTGIQAFSSIPIKIAGKEIRPFQYLFPFMTVAGNMANASLDYTPVGLYRATADLGKSAIEKRGHLGKFMLGSALTATAYAMAEAYLDDKDPWFAVYGGGPTNKADRAAWKAQGGKPFSVKVGERYVRYAETPAVFALGALGAVFDRVRYDKSFDRKNAFEIVKSSIGGMGKSFVDNSFLKSVATMLDAVRGEPGVDLSDAFIVNPAKGFIPLAGAGRMISKLIENPIDTKNDFYAKLVSGIPLVQSIGTRPALNAFGEPIERSWEDRLSFVGRFYSERVKDPEWRWLAETGYTLPDFGTTVQKQYAGKRTKELGAAWAGVLTPDERYELIEKSGPKIKKLVESYRKKYSNLPYSEQTQEQLSKAVKQIRATVKPQVIFDTKEVD